jgi:hypothetical protein
MYSPQWLIVSGLLCPVVYRVVWFVPVAWLMPGLGRTKDGIGDPPQLAEFVQGVVYVFGLWLAIHGALMK